MAIVSFALSSACAPSRATDAVPWGGEAVAYFDELSHAFSEDDVYGILDFFAPDALVEYRTDHFRGAARTAPDLLQGNRADLSRDLLEVYLSAAAAVTLLRLPDSGDFGAAVAELRDGLITRETLFVDTTSLQRSLRTSPDVVAEYEDLYWEYAAGWSSRDSQRLAALYAPDASFHDPLSGVEVHGRDDIAQLPHDEVVRWTAVPVGPAASPPAESPALFLDPVRYGHDPQRAIGIYQVDRDDGCSHRLAVRWEVADGLIVDERRFVEVESFRRCADDLAEGWWTGLTPPGPRDQVVTGTVRTPSGQSVAIHNGTPRLEQLLEWGLQRFAAAGLVEPRVDSATFEPTRRCAGVFGRVSETAGSRHLVLCVYDGDLCTAEGCETPALNIRAGMLHELGHAWMLDHTDASTRSRLLALSGRTAWSDDGAVWAERGVEYAAEVLAWGLADEPLRLVQLGEPPCRELMAAFELLTGSRPSPTSGGCPP